MEKKKYGREFFLKVELCYEQGLQQSRSAVSLLCWLVMLQPVKIVKDVFGEIKRFEMWGLFTPLWICYIHLIFLEKELTWRLLRILNLVYLSGSDD